MSDRNLTIFHNPMCSKSRETMQLLNDNAQSANVVEYLKAPPDRKTLMAIIAKGIPAKDLIRSGDKAFKEAGFDIEKMSDEAIIDAILQNPALMQRPIVVQGDKAIIGRPPVKVLELIQPG